MQNMIGYHQTVGLILRSGGMLVGKNKLGTEVYRVGENVIASLKDEKLIKVIAKNVEENEATIYDFEKQIIINTKKTGNKNDNFSKIFSNILNGKICDGLKKRFTSIDTGETIAELTMCYDKNDILRLIGKTPSGYINGSIFRNDGLRRITLSLDGLGRTRPYKQGLKEFFALFNARIYGQNEAETKAKFLESADFQYAYLNEVLEKIPKKIKQYMNIVPENSKLTKPVIVQQQEVQSGFTIDKTKSGETEIVIKLGNDLRNWDKNDAIEILRVRVNKQGQMIEGVLTGVCGKFKFTRGAKNARRIDFKNQVFVPDGKTSDSWACTKYANHDQTYSLDNSLIKSAKLSRLFLEWAGVHATVV